MRDAVTCYRRWSVQSVNRISCGHEYLELALHVSAHEKAASEDTFNLLDTS